MTSNSEDFNTEKSLLNIHKLDQSLLKTSNNILIIGSRHCGKTELTKHIISLQEPNTKFYLFTTNPDSFKFQGMHYKDINQKNLDAIIKNSYFTNDKKNKTVVIFDDVLLKNNLHFTNYLEVSRSFNIKNIITLQYDFLLPKVRMNIDTVMFFEDQSISNKKRYYDLYFGFIGDFKKYMSVFNETAKKYQLCCVNKNKLYIYNYNLVDDIKYFNTEAIFSDKLEQEFEKSKQVENINTNCLIKDCEKKQLIKQLLDQNEKILELLKTL